MIKDTKKQRVNYPKGAKKRDSFIKEAGKSVAFNVFNTSKKPDVWRKLKTLWREKE
jgi:hypothetical protein